MMLPVTTGLPPGSSAIPSIVEPAIPASHVKLEPEASNLPTNPR